VDTKLNISELFYSLQGETTRAGLPSFFIRTAGCNLDCSYCDTRYAKTVCVSMPVRDILKTASHFPFADHVTITGGEPLLQEGIGILMEMLIKKKHRVQVETNGSMSLRAVPPGVRKIVDVKTPGSGEQDSFLMENLAHIGAGDEIKFVISGPEDYNYSKAFIKKFLDKKECVINFSPVYGMMPLAELADSILRDRLRVRLNAQLHKLIWPGGEPKDH
jgi:7-carboxy-7-deazaguanine synthase